jgi:hypothetical protein
LPLWIVSLFRLGVKGRAQKLVPKRTRKGEKDSELGPFQAALTRIKPDAPTIDRAIDHSMAEIMLAESAPEERGSEFTWRVFIFV